MSESRGLLSAGPTRAGEEEVAMSPHRCRVKLIGRACEHDLCVEIRRGLPPELRCDHAEPRGYGTGGGPPCGCTAPAGIAEFVMRELRDDLQESRRRGYVMIRAA